MRTLLFITAGALLTGAAPPKKLTPTEIVAASPASAWKTIDPDDLLVMDLANGAQPFLTQERITSALANLDVSVACIGSTRTRQAVALVEGAGYVDPTRRGRMTCLTRGSS